MVMGGQRGYPLKCESCGHEDAVFFGTRFGIGPKELAYRAKGYKKCPDCGGKMKADPDKHIAF